LVRDGGVGPADAPGGQRARGKEPPDGADPRQAPGAAGEARQPEPAAERRPLGARARGAGAAVQGAERHGARRRAVRAPFAAVRGPRGAAAAHGRRGRQAARLCAGGARAGAGGRGRVRARDHRRTAAQGLGRGRGRDRRDPRRHGRRRGGAVLRQPAAHVRAVRAAPPVEARDDRHGQRRRQGQRGRGQGVWARRVWRADVRVGRAPGAAHPGDRDHGPHPHQHRDRGCPAAGDGRPHHRERVGSADRRVPRVGQGRPACKYHRQRRAHHPHPDRD
ncbi:hypothetical protein IWQ56_007036, partial [Coemansia nantahalensis]